MYEESDLFFMQYLHNPSDLDSLVIKIDSSTFVDSANNTAIFF